MLFTRTQSTLRLGLKSIRVHPLRSSLTVMGIILGVASVILMRQLRVVDTQQFIRRLGRVSVETMHQVDDALLITLGLVKL